MLSVLSKSPAERIAPLWEAMDIQPDYTLIKPPEIGMVMVKAKTGGNGLPFNMGEMTVTRTVLQLDSSEFGYGYTAGRDKQKSITIALIDACFQKEEWREQLSTQLFEPLANALEQEKQQHEDRVDRTKVDFFTMVRGE